MCMCMLIVIRLLVLIFRKKLYLFGLLLNDKLMVVFHEPRRGKEKKESNVSLHSKEENEKKENKSLTDELNSTFN